jgi:N-hydroxyarylamine O-acetyltransferase
MSDLNNSELLALARLKEYNPPAQRRTMDLNAYFERVNYKGSGSPTVETLRALHRAHLLAVPFENLDIHIPRPISLEESALFDKIVTRRRGGFCYEQNGLFAAVLRSLGFAVSLLEARVKIGDGSFGRPFDHLTLLVRLEQPWLADVGFGDSFLEPLRLADPAEQLQDGDAFRVRLDGQQGVYAMRDPTNGWQDEYQFFLQPRHLADFAEACHYHQTSPASHFTQKRICSLARPAGRITLSDMRFIVTENGKRTETTLSGEAEFDRILVSHFGMRLPL